MLHHVKYGIRNLTSWKRWFKDIYLDFKHGFKFLGGNINNSNPAKGRSPSTSSDYEAIANIFSKITLQPNDILVDIGCGKGRVFNWMLHNSIGNKMIGIEVDEKIAEFTRKRLKQYSHVQIKTGDIADKKIFPKEGTIFYLFNPFSAAIVKKFADHLLKFKDNYPEKNRPLIVYYNCCYLNVFEDNNWKIEKLGVVSGMGLEAAIISFN